ncbi:MAG: dephospho-CoA kinase [Clostridia bacterium]|nr:dephospho-CoA kinase [Clostridia bacterium]
MVIIGLTGGSGVGKGCVCREFLKYNINSIDTDQTARQVCDKGKPCLNELVTYFGNVILNDDGTLNRKQLASIAFADKDKHAFLNKTTHYYILNEARAWLNTQRAEGHIAAIVDAPLLFESSFDKECDVIISVTAPREKRIERLLIRDNIPLEAIELRLSKQWNDEFYTEKSNFVIQNNGSLEEVAEQVKKIYNQLFSSSNME